MTDAWLPVLTLMTSLAPAILIFRIPDERRGLRTAVNLAGAILKLTLVAWMVFGVAAGRSYEMRIALVPGLDFLLRVDALGLLFLALSALLWLLTTLYAIAYFGDRPRQSRFFGFFSLCVAATTGIALSGTLFTFFVFYELLTLSTWPLVAHKGDRASIAAGRTYLAYTLGGGAALLAGMMWLHALIGPVTLGAPSDIGLAEPWALRAIFALLIGGLGVKAALIPFHGWLPAAMVAPAPVSALLHAVAVVKAGAFGIVRVTHDVYGLDLVQALGMDMPLVLLASATILYGSARALFQPDIKRRLAFSTVSQVSYIALGVALAGPAATVGGLVHLVHQGLMKITLFFCAGALAERAGVTRVDQMDGVGRAMPRTMLAFSIAALGMIGAPPVAGFVTKWQLGTGALQGGEIWVIFVLGASSLMSAGYFLPMLYRAWFLPPAQEARADAEQPAMLIWPAMVTAAAALLVGLFAGMDYSPLRWAQWFVSRDYDA